MTKVLVTPHRFEDLDPERARLEPLGADLLVAQDEQDLHRLAPQATALLVATAAVDGELISRLEQCKAIVRYGVGVDGVDVGEATAAGIPVGNVLDANVEEVAAHTVMLALACLRRLPETQRSLAEGSWGAAPVRGVRRASTLTAGILGLGRIGTAVARRLEAFGMTILGYDPLIDESPYPLLGLEELLRRSDLVCVHLPLTDDTRGLLSDHRLALMGPRSVIVNTSRGEIVDEQALSGRLADGTIGGAGIDVFATEPLPPDAPLRTAPHAILTPHVAWYSSDAVRQVQASVAEQAARALRGERLDPVVNPAVYV